MNTKLHLPLILLVLCIVFLGLCCQKETPEPDPMEMDMEGMTAAEFFQTLPSWEAFAQNPAEADTQPTGEAPTSVSETLDVPQIQEDGSIDTLYNVTYNCESTPFTLTQNPEQLVMYSPDIEILWPGALIQGSSHKDPLGSLRGLVINERDSINVSIPGLPTGNNFRRVKPNQAVVGSAIGEMIGSATTEGLSTPSSISFSMESYHSEKQMALKMGLSGKYLGYNGTASGSFDRNQSETTVTVQFYQKMYEVVVEPPQTPAAFFSEDFTPEKLQEQVNLGRMGPTNLPVYVSNVVYGRMMMFSLTSSASETDIRAMLNVAYNSIGANVTANMSAKQKTILEESKVAITSLGGNAEATIAMIQSGNWRDYFTDSAPLSSAAPLSYTFRNLGDGSIAKIVETDEFSISECTAVVGVPGVYDFYPGVSEATNDIDFPVETFSGDFNGDGHGDILYNHKQGNTNQLKIAYGNTSGSFDFQSVVNNSISPLGGWQSYDTYIGDINGDGLSDIIWNKLTTDNNASYFAINLGNGQFVFSEISERSGSSWDLYNPPLLADVDDDGADELVWTITNDSYALSIYVGQLSNSEDAIEIPNSTVFSSNYWGDYKPMVGNINGGGDDIIFQDLEGYNSTRVALADGNGSFTLSPTTSRSEDGWWGTKAGAVFANNDTNTDMVFIGGLSIYVNLSNGDGSFDVINGSSSFENVDNSGTYQPYFGDVDGNGIDDITFTNHGVGQIESHIYTALGTNSGIYDVSAVKQTSPFVNTWSQYTTFMLDINGDGKNDMLWIKPGSTTEYYVAVAK